mmetsp:Transcript_22609/g.31509  ORF Transcript_22609/g.31509 Transcript_22609/m.31509 type:complete len:259 (+) Transcript_22609:222-998(+)|eukprot:CAMPEP_0196581552 /NCGR_PEP_ID=MMETSP1081-20130531/34166_1 /TAXON_ID=36882 /ORGANISM="Pyramimonas amylifera, Strain CCMP720" /LENGTH=258 /DNA_ID=CAMNT_0041901817 /DNA_START=211 /DNA_END=987 /DNA_ORIENTATION=-
MGQEALQISPSELKFRFELRKQIPTTLRLYNPSSEHVAFKVKTTSPKKYCVRPNTGLLPPGGAAEVMVIMQQQKEAPSDLHACKDKFLVQSVPVEEDAQRADLDYTDLFTKEKDKGTISEIKLRVLYEVPNPPPSPVPENEEAEMNDLPVSTSSPFTAAASTMPSSGAAGDMQTKYQNAIASLAVATNERNAAASESDRLRRELTSMASKVEKLEVASSQIKKSEPTLAASKAAAGFTLMHLLITAIIFFLLGYFLEG